MFWFCFTTDYPEGARREERKDERGAGGDGPGRERGRESSLHRWSHTGACLPGRCGKLLLTHKYMGFYSILLIVNINFLYIKNSTTVGIFTFVQFSSLLLFWQRLVSVSPVMRPSPQPVRTLPTASPPCPRVLLPAPASGVPWLRTPSPRSTADVSESE